MNRRILIHSGLSFTLAVSVLFVQARGRTDLVPQPVNVVATEGAFTVTAATRLVVDGSAQCRTLAAYLKQYTDTWFGTSTEVITSYNGQSYGSYIKLSIDTLLYRPDRKHARMPAEGYVLHVSGNGVEVTGVDYGGLFNGIQTLLQLMPATIYAKRPGGNEMRLEGVDISDWPQFAYRGQMLDVARTFVEVPQVKRFIDNMAYHKLNRLHWHLADDEGWRIEIKSYPWLAQTGGYRGYDQPVKPSYGLWWERYGGYYTQDQIREVVAYAAERNIEIIPEIDLPGHSRAAAAVYPEILCDGKPDNSAGDYDKRNVWCASREENYVMIRCVLEEICALFPSEYIHIGGDEVEKDQWLDCLECRRKAHGKDVIPVLDYFLGRVTAILADMGRLPVMWDEATESGKASKTALISGWRSVKTTLDATAKGYRTIFMPGSYFYFDMKQSPWEPGHTWAGINDTHRICSLDFGALGFSPQQMECIVGVEGTFFSELLLSNGGEAYLDYQCYPRICALSEVAWTQPALRSSDGFHDRLYGKHVDRLSGMGIAFRVPPPEATYRSGEIAANTSYRYTGLYYTVDGRRLGKEEAYCCPISDSQLEKYRFFMEINGQRSVRVPAMLLWRNGAAPGETVRMTIPCPDREGLWYLRIASTEPDAQIASIRVEGRDTSYHIIRSAQKVNGAHMLRVYVTPKTRDANIVIDIRNENRLPAQLSYRIERSVYLEPKVTVSSTMGDTPRLPLSNAADYNFSSYGRTACTCRKGDHIVFLFDEPLDCASIDVQTGYLYLPRFHIPAGDVEISSDGVYFEKIGELKFGKAQVKPIAPILALRIVSSAEGNGDDFVAIQDLRIIPRRR